MKTSGKPEYPSMLNQDDNSDSGLSDIHSFVLRVRLNKPPSGKGTTRFQFQIEEIGTGAIWHCADFDCVIERLSTSIEAITNSLDR